MLHVFIFQNVNNKLNKNSEDSSSGNCAILRFIPPPQVVLDRTKTKDDVKHLNDDEVEKYIAAIFDDKPFVYSVRNVSSLASYISCIY